VRVIGPDSEQLGIMATPDAFKKAEEMGYDLVEVAPTAQPPVCKIMDYGKYKYELNKKAHTAKQHQRGTQLKEIKLRPRTDKHDLETKVRQIKEFLGEGNKTKVTVMFRGREMAYQEMGRSVLDKVIALLGGCGQIEQPPRQEGRFLVMVLAPK
jgi:translation initiation factor IF-3